MHITYRTMSTSLVAKQMTKQFNLESKEIAERMLRLQGFFGSPEFLHAFKQHCKINGTEPHPSIVDIDGNFDPQKLVMDIGEYDYKQLGMKYDKYLKKEEPNKHRWIQISPDPIRFKTMLELYKHFSQINLDDFIGCVEAHTENGYRPHIHMMLFDMHTRPNRIIKKLSNYFECKENFIHCKISTDFKRNYEYINGNKCNEKKCFVDSDKSERERDGIPHVIDKRHNA